jgi:hypothetical protein
MQHFPTSQKTVSETGGTSRLWHEVIDHDRPLSYRMLNTSTSGLAVKRLTKIELYFTENDRSCADNGRILTTLSDQFSSGSRIMCRARLRYLTKLKWY